MAHIVADRVYETSTSTGTGAFTLAGAALGFRTAASVCSVGDTFFYAIQAVDAGGAPSGAWECGLGTYSSANTLTRTTVTASSNAGAAVNFAAGSKQVFLTVTATHTRWMRERLTANRTYYVATTGSDSNDGLTAGTPFLTLQKAADTVMNTLDIQYGVVVTIQVADGTYTAGVVLRTLTGAGSVVLQGNTTTPANCVINVTGGSCVTVTRANNYLIKGFKLLETGGYGVAVTYNSSCILQNLDFGACSNRQVSAVYGSFVDMGFTSITLSGGSTTGIAVSDGSTVFCNGTTFTLSGTPAYSGSFVSADTSGVVEFASASFTGSATGSRYSVTSNGLVWTNGQATTWLPGNAAGTTSSSGVYG